MTSAQHHVAGEPPPPERGLTREERGRAGGEAETSKFEYAASQQKR